MLEEAGKVLENMPKASCLRSVPLSDTQHNFIYCCISMTHTGSLTIWFHPENHPLLSKGPVPTLVASAEPDPSAPSC